MVELVCLGEIVGVHGIKGHVKIKTYTSTPESIASYGLLKDKNLNVSYKIKSLRVLSSSVVVAFLEGVNDRNQAEGLIGVSLYVERSQLPPLGEDEFYHEDLVGMNVVSCQNGEILGAVLGLNDFGAGVFLDIKTVSKVPSQSSDMKETTIDQPKIGTLPFTKDSIISVDLANKVMIIDENFLIH